jgi:cation transport ATPase
MNRRYQLKGMRCDACAGKIRVALERISGLSQVEVSLNPPEARFVSAEAPRLSDLQAAVSSAGDYGISENASSASNTAMPGNAGEESLRPLFIVVSYLIGIVLLRSAVSHDWSPHVMMSTFMGGFFLIFSLFKLLDLRGFAEAFATYDLLAARSQLFAMAYPFIEILLGVSYLVEFAPLFTNLTTLLLMIIGSAGVGRALLSKRRIQCACLGTALKLPMTKVTLGEDLLMGGMAAAMLIL